MTNKRRIATAMFIAAIAVSVIAAEDPGGRRPNTIMPQPGCQPSNPTFEYGIDRIGSNFRDFDLNGACPELCANACKEDSRCRAWTYVRPNTIQGGNPRCFLKSAIPPASPNSATVSGTALTYCVTTAHAPGAVATGVPYEVSWQSTDSIRYEVQEATRPDFSDAVSSIVTATTNQYLHLVTEPSTYYYRVKPVDCPSGTSFGSITQTTVLPQQAPSSREFDLVVPFGATVKVPQEMRFENQPPGAAFSVTVDQSYLSVNPRTGVIPSNGILSITVTGDPTKLPVGANTGTVILTVTTPNAGRKVTHGSTTTSTKVSISLVTPVSGTPKGSPPDDAIIIPAVAHLVGAGAAFQSDVRLTNANATDFTYFLTFTPSNTDGTTSGRMTAITVPTEQTVALNDVLRDFFGFAQPSDSAGGALEVRSASGPIARTFLTSRTYATTSIGTFGQFIPAVPLSKFLKAGAGSLTLTRVSQGSAFRSNLGLVEGLGIAISGRLRIFSPGGQNVRDVPFSLKPFEFQQLNGFLAANGVPMDDARVEVVVDSGSGLVSAYASVLDNITQDPLLASPVKTSTLAANRYILPGMADLERADTNFHSDVRIFNPAESAVESTLTFFPLGDPTAPTARNVTLAPGEIKTFDDVLPTLFGLRATGGSIVVTTSANSSLVVSGRTYTNAPGGGTFGQFIPAVTPAEGIGAGDPPLQILQLEQSSGFRSNVGLNELTGNPVTVEVSVVLADSKVTPSTTVALKANELQQLNGLIASLNPGRNSYNARVLVRVISGSGRVTAYASVIDNRSLDPTYIPAQ